MEPYLSGTLVQWTIAERGLSTEGPTSFELNVLVVHRTVKGHVDGERVGAPSQGPVGLLGEEREQPMGWVWQILDVGLVT